MKIDDFKQNLSDEELKEFVEDFKKYKETRTKLLNQRKDKTTKADVFPSIKKTLEIIAKDND
ncbi:hypothetical protein NNC41_12000 [Enterococcus faecium]|nr:hypothetical protein [Enterococcus faecium]HAQ1518019.1 hypothetical protein [Enterococcus faecium]